MGLCNKKPPKIISLDTLGAGDVWHGAFTLALTHNKSPFQAIEFANIAASMKCEKYGGKNGTPYKKELSINNKI